MIRITIVLVILFVSSIGQSDAQILKGFGKKLEKKIEGKIEKKADRHVDKVIDKADKKTDKPIDDVIDGKPVSQGNKKQSSSAVVPDTNVSSPQASHQTLSNGVLMMPGNSCSDFIWFKPGAMMEFETSDGKGRHVSRSKMEILSVNNDGAVTVANAKASDGEGAEYEMQFKCAGDKMYMDFSSLIKDAMAKAGNSGAEDAEVRNVLDNTEIGFSDGFLSFPKTMYPGQELDEVSVSIVSNSESKMPMEMISSLTERKVVSNENVSTEAGSFDCVKITGIRKTSIKIMGINKKMRPIVEEVWFAPGIGIIKQNSYDDKGKLEAVMQLTAYKL